MADQFETLTLTLDTGEVTIKLRPDLAPKHVERIGTLANEGFYALRGGRRRWKVV